MRMTCHREGLLAACQLASVAVAARDIKPILKNLKAIADGDRCTLMATDLELGVRLDVRSVNVSEGGEAILPAARLTSILRESLDDELALEADTSQCVVRGQFNEFKMPGEDPVEFPDLPTFSEEKYHEITANVLREMIRRTVFAAAGKESTRFTMTGVLWELEEKQLRLVATDGRRLAICTGPALSHDGHESKGQTHVVPTKAMSLLERLLHEDEEPIRVLLRPNEALFKTDRAMVYTRLVEGRYPDYRQVVPKKIAAKVTITAGPLHSAVRQAAIMADEESKRVRFRFAKEKLTLEAQSATTGSSRVDMPLEYDGKPIEISFSPNYLTDMLRVIPADTELVFELVDGNSPALIRCGSDYSYVIMPLT